MQDDEYTIPVFHDSRGEGAVVLTVRQIDRDYLLWCRLPSSSEVLSFQASDCFAALQGLRKKAEGRGWKICCAGARKNVWPSGMAREMGGGLKAYVLSMGEAPARNSMVDILEPDDPGSYCSVAEQEAFAKDWFESRGQR